MGGSFKERMAKRKRSMGDGKKGSRGAMVPKGEHCPTGKMGRGKMHGRSGGGAR